MNPFLIVLRILHIVSGMFWVGGSLVTAFFVSPALAATGEPGQKVLAHLITKARLHTAIAAAAIVTVLAGGTLYWIDSQGLTSKWTTSGPGLGFGLGALFALVGIIFGLMVGQNMGRMGQLAAKLTGKPTPDQMAVIVSAKNTLAYAGPVSSVALVLALLCMATARYWVF